jgi:hypothetical protein
MEYARLLRSASRQAYSTGEASEKKSQFDVSRYKLKPYGGSTTKANLIAKLYYKTVQKSMHLLFVLRQR